MKVVVFKVDNRSRQIMKKQSRLNIERVLFLAFIVTFAIVIIAQTALMTPSIRTFVAGDSRLEGTPLGVEEFLYSKGEISLELIDSEANSSIKVLVNGEEVAAFNSKTINISVMDRDIVEIDASSLENTVEVAVSSITDNISEECSNKSIKVGSGVRMLTQIRIE